jgi:LacI family transcriptional regulator
LADRLSPPLTTVRVHHYKVGTEAAELVLNVLDRPPHERVPRQVVMPAEPIVRGSTGPARGEPKRPASVSIKDGEFS